jgi:hypothetical protein
VGGIYNVLKSEQIRENQSKSEQIRANQLNKGGASRGRRSSLRDSAGGICKIMKSEKIRANQRKI